MFCCCKTKVLFNFLVGWWALQCVQRPCQILGVSCGFGIQTTKNNLHFKNEKKNLLKRKSMVLFLFRFPPATFTKTLQNMFPGGVFSMSHLLILLILHLVRRDIHGIPARFPTWDGVFWKPPDVNYGDNIPTPQLGSCSWMSEASTVSVTNSLRFFFLD